VFGRTVLDATGRAARAVAGPAAVETAATVGGKARREAEVCGRVVVEEVLAAGLAVVELMTARAGLQPDLHDGLSGVGDALQGHADHPEMPLFVSENPGKG